MKVVIAILIFISAAEAIRNLVGLPEERLSRLHNLLKDGPIDGTKLTNPSNSKTTAHLAGLFKKDSLNDHGDSDSGEGEGGPDPVETLAETLRHIGPALKKLKEARDKKSEENAKELLAAIKHGKHDDELKALFGRHVVAQHQDCTRIKKKFAEYVHESVLVELLKGEEDTLDFQEDLAKVFEAAKMYEFDVFEAFSHLADVHELRDHPGIKAIMMIGGMVVGAACDEKLDGLFKTIGELVEEHDPHGEFDLGSRINLDIYSKNSRVCRHGFPNKHRDPRSGIRERLLDLINDPDCKEVNFMRFIVDTVMESIELAKKFGHLHAIAKGYENVVIQHVTYFMQHGQEDLAYKILGEYVLANLRGALTVGLAIEKRLKGKPTAAPEVTTAAPVETTGATTGGLESTTAGPESTTEAPESTTAAPESTTAAPESTTEAPESTTEAPESTTAAPESTTAAPESTTEAPESTTAAPESTTAAPESTTAAPESTTEAPESTTAAPESTTEEPESTTAAPTEGPTTTGAQPTP